MGISVTTYLGFGIELGELLPWQGYDEETYEQLYPEYEEVDELGEFLALKKGLQNPWDDMPAGYSYENRARFPKFDKATDEWTDLKIRLENEAPIEFGYAGMYDYQAYTMILRGTQYADYKFDGVLPKQPAQEQVEAAAAWCVDQKFPDFSNSRWILYAHVG